MSTTKIQTLAESQNKKKMERCNISLSILVVIITVFFSISGVRSCTHPINVWPQPTSFKWPNPHATTLSPNFSVTSPPHRHLDIAVRRYVHEVLTERHRPLVTPLLNLSSSRLLTTLAITVRDVDAPLSHGVDESYALIVPCYAEVAVLKAATVWSAMRGLETFLQLVYAADQSVTTLLRVGCGLEISDKPIFPHRGLLLDTARNYYEISDLMRLMKTMSMNKMNVFHWHITDSQSFPLALPSEPMIAEKGAYGEYMKYTVDDVRRLVEYGMEHGVRVVPEIDMPAHAGSWAKAYPEIVTCADKFWWPAESDWSDRLASEPGTGQLNPLNPKTYEVVQNIVRDVISMFPDQFYHAGADEITPNCWKIDPLIQNYLSDNGTLGQILEKFVNSTLPHILSLNRTVIYWEDVILDATVNVSSLIIPSENVILQTWNNGPSNTKKIVSSGYRAIVSSSEYYYLDCGHGGFVGNDSQYDLKPGSDQGQGGSWCGPFKTWQTIYNYDITFNLTEEEKKLVIGGEVALWSEQSDPMVMDSRIWPRASAMAESLWSGNRDEMGNKRYAEATDRLSEWRHRMVARGIRAEPIQPLWCVHNPGMCNTVHVS